MKAMKNIVVSLTTAVCFTGLALSFNACTEQSPLTSKTDDLSRKSELNIIKLGNATLSLKKITEVSKWITVQNGGILSIEHEGADANDLEVEVSLEILPGTISEDAEVKISLDDTQFLGNLDVVFHPHGITFSQPAILNIAAKNLDLGEINPTLIDIYYYNAEAGQWEPMPRDAIDIDKDGDIDVVNARLPHFSRYAIGWGSLR